MKKKENQRPGMRSGIARNSMKRLFCMCGLAGISVSGWAQSAGPVSLTLPQAIDLALKQNRDVQLAELAVVDTEHKKEIARSAYFPHIRNESGVLHLTELAGIEVPGGAFGTFGATGPIPAKKLVIDQGSLTTYTSGTGLAQPLTQMFKIHESNRAATADIQTAKVEVEQAQNEVALKVRQLYYGILVAQLKQQSAAEEVEAGNIKLRESIADVERGRALDVESLGSRAALLEAKQLALAETLQIHDLTVTLNDLLGLPLTSELKLDEDPLGRLYFESVPGSLYPDRPQKQP